MSESSSSSELQTAVGRGLLALGIAVFALRLQHDGAYAVPRGGNLFGGLGALLLGGMRVWSAAPHGLRWLALAASPVVLFFGLYAAMAELEEVVSLYTTDSAGQPAELRLWIVDCEDGEWVGMPRSKAVEHPLDGARLELLRNGETRWVVPALHEDRATVTAIPAASTTDPLLSQRFVQPFRAPRPVRTPPRAQGASQGRSGRPRGCSGASPATAQDAAQRPPPTTRSGGPWKA